MTEIIEHKSKLYYRLNWKFDLRNENEDDLPFLELVYECQAILFQMCLRQLQFYLGRLWPCVVSNQRDKDRACCCSSLGVLTWSCSNRILWYLVIFQLLSSYFIYLKIIFVFTGGSLFGLVSISHVLGYVLKRWNQIVISVIIGFISGSLGIVWPWKKTIFLKEKGTFVLDIKQHKIVENYERFIPDFSIT